MIISKSSFPEDYLDHSDLEIDKEAECLSYGYDIPSDQDDVVENQELNTRKSIMRLGSRAGSKIVNFMSSLIFLSLLEKADGGLLSVGWIKLRSSLCIILYIKECFDKAISKGEDIPNVSITDKILYILNKSDIYVNSDNASISPLMFLDPEVEAKELHYVDDYFIAIYRNLAFSESNMLRIITEKSMKDYEHLYNVGEIKPPYLYELNSYQLNDHAIRSNVSRSIISKIGNEVLNIIRSGGYSYIWSNEKNYCPNISKYVHMDDYVSKNRVVPMVSTATPINTSAGISTLDDTTVTTLNTVQTSCIELPALAVVLTFAAFLFLFVSYAVFSLVKHNRFSFLRKRNFGTSRRRSDCSDKRSVFS